MEKNAEMVNVMFCLDDKYAPKLAVALASLLDHNQDILDRLRIILRTTDMSTDTESKIKSIGVEYNLNPNRIEIIHEEELSKELGEANIPNFKNTYLVYYRIFGLEKYVEEGRLLSLDCDLIIMDSILPLYNYDLDGKAVGAVGQYGINRDEISGAAIREYNGGVILYDMDRYIKENLDAKFIETMDKIPNDKWNLAEQTVFSYCMERYDLVVALPLRYNSIINYDFFSYEEFCVSHNIDGDWYSKKDYDEAKELPCIKHLIGGYFVISPWNYGGDKKLKAEMEKYLKHTPYWGKKGIYTHIEKKTRVINFMCRLLCAVLPRNQVMHILSRFC